MRQTIRQFYGQNIQQSKDYIRIINDRHFDRLKQLIETTNGQILFKGGEPDRADLFIPPTIVGKFSITRYKQITHLDCEMDDPLMQDELFGPILPIITVDSAINDGINLINKGREPLTSYIFTRDDRKVQRLIKETQSGSVLVKI